MRIEIDFLKALIWNIILWSFAIWFVSKDPVKIFAEELQASNISSDYKEEKFREPSVSPEGYNHVYDFAYRNGQLTGQAMRCYCRTYSSEELYFYKDGTLIKFVTLSNLQNNTTSNVPCVSTISWYQGSNTSVANSNPYNSSLNATNNQWGYNSGASLIEWNEGSSAPYVMYSGVDVYNSFNDLVKKFVQNDDTVQPIFVNANYTPVVFEGANNHLYLPGIDFHFVTNSNSYRIATFDSTTNTIIDGNAYYFPSKTITSSLGGNVNVTNNGLSFITYQLDDYQAQHLNDFNLNYTIYFSDFIGPVQPNIEKLNYTGQIIDQYNSDMGAIFMQNGKYGSYTNLTPILRSDKNYLVVDIWLTDNLGNSSGHYKKYYQRGSDPDGVVADNSISINSDPFFENDTNLNDNNNNSGFGYLPSTSSSNSITVNVNNNDPDFKYDFEGVGKYTGEEVRVQIKDMFGLLSTSNGKGYLQSFLELFNHMGYFGAMLGFGVATTVSIAIIRIILRR